MKSRVKRDFHARFRENVGVKFPCVTRLWASLKNDSEDRHELKNLILTLLDSNLRLAKQKIKVETSVHLKIRGETEKPNE